MYTPTATEKPSGPIKLDEDHIIQQFLFYYMNVHAYKLIYNSMILQNINVLKKGFLKMKKKKTSRCRDRKHIAHTSSKSSFNSFSETTWSSCSIVSLTYSHQKNSPRYGMDISQSHITWARVWTGCINAYAKYLFYYGP